MPSLTTSRSTTTSMVCLNCLPELRRIAELDEFAVHPGPGVALGGQFLEEVDEFALASADHRRQDLEAGALGQLEQLVHDLLRGLLGDGFAADGAVRPSHARPQQAHVVVDLGDGAHRGAGVLAGGLLVDGDGRREAFDEVDVGLVHLAQELPGVGGQRLDVAALALGEDGVEGQRRLPGTGEPGEDDHGVAGQVQVHVAQVVLPRALDDEAGQVGAGGRGFGGAPVSRAHGHDGGAGHQRLVLQLRL